MSLWVKQYGEFVFGGDAGQHVDLDAVTALVGVEPTSTWRPGDALPSGRLRTRPVWVWATREERTHDSETVLRRVLERFVPVADAVEETRRRFTLWASIGLVISMFGDLESDGRGGVIANVTTPSVAFSVDTIKQLAALGVPFDCDQYVIAPSTE